MPTNRILKQPKSLGLAAVLFATFLVLILVLTPQPVNIQAAANVQPQLLSLAASTPKTVVRVMIHKANTDADVVGLVTQAGGMVIHDLHIVNAVVAEMEAGTAVALANNPTIAGINLDGYLVSSDATIHTVRDDFNKRLFSNNDGTTNWAGDWIEIGDDANPGRGDIRMMSDGTLRLKDDNRSLQRAVDLTGAATAVLSLDYRRDGISGSQDYITLEVSADGGQSWTELNRFAGPDSDSVFQHASYDITAYTSPKTIIRFVNSNQLGNYDILYLDFVQIEFTVGTSGNEDTGDNSPPLTTPPTSSGRITEGLQVLYTFDESNGTTIYDNSGVGTPLDLTIENNSYSWSNGDLSHTQANRAANEQDSNKIYQACTASNEISLEAWITPLDNNQGGPARIITFSLDGYKRNFTLAQDGSTYVTRLRTTTNGSNGTSIVAEGGYSDTTLTHLLFTRSADNTANLYINGSVVDTVAIGGDFSNWDASFDFGLGNEFSADSSDTNRDWVGKYHLAAVYCQALTAKEVEQNYQAGIDSTGSATANHYLETLFVQPVWEMGYQGQGVTVAVIDSGISPGPDFGSRLLTQVTFNEDTETVNDTNGHGTHVAGIIGGDGTNSSGFYQGIAPQVNLIGLKVSDDEGKAYESDTVAAMQWVLENKDTYNIRVVNLSLNSTEAQSYHDSALDLAAELLWFNDVVVVTSAGNRSTDGNFYTITASPANDPFIITVGASLEQNNGDISDDTIALFSAHGKTVDGFIKPDIIAPGKNIVSVLSTDSAWKKLKPERAEGNGTYFRLSGTSMSAPMVSGAAALLLQAEPNLTPDQVKYRLMTSGNWVTPFWFDAILDRTIYPYLNVGAAVFIPDNSSANQDIMPHMALAKMALIAYWASENGGGENIDWSNINWDSVNWDNVNWDSVNWGSVNWGSVNWGSVNWGSVNWGSVNWGSVNWGSVNWGSVNWGSVNWGSVNWGSVNWGSVSWDD